MDSITEIIGHDENPLSGMYRLLLNAASNASNRIDAIAVNSHTMLEMQRSKITVCHSDNDLARKNAHSALCGVRLIVDESVPNHQIEFRGEFDSEFIKSITGEKL